MEHFFWMASWLLPLLVQRKGVSDFKWLTHPCSFLMPFVYRGLGNLFVQSGCPGRDRPDGLKTSYSLFSPTQIFIHAGEIVYKRKQQNNFAESQGHPNPLWNDAKCLVSSLKRRIRKNNSIISIHSNVCLEINIVFSLVWRSRCYSNHDKIMIQK